MILLLSYPKCETGRVKVLVDAARVPTGVPLCLDSSNTTEDQDEFFRSRYFYRVAYIFDSF